MVRSYFILGLSLAQAALVFENHDLNHLDIDFSKSSLSVLDRVAREFDDESSGDEELPLNPDSAAPTATPKSDITAVMKDVSTPEVIEDNTVKNVRVLGQDGVSSTSPLTPLASNTTTPAGGNTTSATPAPEPEPENGASHLGLASTLIAALIAVFFL
jgi:hypothetical protein